MRLVIKHRHSTDSRCRVFNHSSLTINLLIFFVKNVNKVFKTSISANATYLNDNAQTPLNWFLVYMLYSQLCNEYSDKSNWWSLGISLSVAWSSVGAISCSPSLTILLIAVNGVPWRIFSNSTVVHTKMGHVSKTMPLLGVICDPFGKTSYSLPLYKIWQLYLQPFLRYGWDPKI